MAFLPARRARAVESTSFFFPHAPPRVVHDCVVFSEVALDAEAAGGNWRDRHGRLVAAPVDRARARHKESEVVTMPMSRPLSVILPQRRRRVPASFAWIDRRVRSQGVLSRMSPDDIALYVFLVLAADRDGLSCWRLDRIERELPLDGAALGAARTRLTEASLIAFRPWSARSRDGTYQVLSIEPCDDAPRRGGLAALRDVLGRSER